MDQAGPGPQTGVRRRLRTKTGLCQDGASQMLIPDQIPHQVCGGGSRTDSSANRTASILRRSLLPSGFQCAPFFSARRGFRGLDRLGVTLFPHTKPPPTQPHVSLQRWREQPLSPGCSRGSAGELPRTCSPLRLHEPTAAAWPRGGWLTHTPPSTVTGPRALGPPHGNEPSTPV